MNKEKITLKDRIQNLLIQGGRLLSRPAGQTQTLEQPSTVRLLTLVSVFLCIFSFGTYFYFLIGKERIQDRLFGTQNFDVSFAKNEWSVLYQDYRKQCEGIFVDRTCPAHPDNPTLWKSQYHRSDTEHVERLKSVRGSTFWTGLVISGERKEKILREQRDLLLVGHVNGDVKVYQNGNLIINRTKRENRGPVFFELDTELLKKPGEIKVSLEITHNEDSTYPDLFFGKVTPVINFSKFTQLWRGWIFQEETRPTALFFSNAILALLFFFFWSSARRKQEYWYLSTFLFIQALMQLTFMDFFYRDWQTATLNRFDIINHSYEGFFILFLGFAYGRARLEIFQYGVPVALLTPIFVSLSLSDPNDLLRVVELIKTNLVPFLSAMGGVYCLFQCYFLSKDKKHLSKLRQRIIRLLFFGLGIIGLSLLYRFQSIGWGSADFLIFGDRFLHLIAVSTLTVVVLLDYREYERVSKDSYIPKWFLEKEVPLEVHGVLIEIDIKSSTQVLRDFDLEKYELFLASWFEACSQEIVKFGGEVLPEDQGDSIIAFFESRGEELPEIRAIEALKSSARKGNEILSLEKLSFLKEKTVAFRGAMVPGPIRPGFKTIGYSKKYDFRGPCRVEMSRILEIKSFEKNYVGRSHIVMERSHWQKVQSSSANMAFVAVDFSGVDKDGVSRHLVILEMSERQSKKQVA